MGNLISLSMEEAHMVAELGGLQGRSVEDVDGELGLLVDGGGA
jgi:hypothetical protein